MKTIVIRAHPPVSDVLWCHGQTAARRSLWGNRSHRASAEPGYRSVQGAWISAMEKQHKLRLPLTHTQTLTLKHSSVTKSLAMEQRDTASGRPSCSAVAASRTRRRDATSLVAISASLNWRNYINTKGGGREDTFIITSGFCSLRWFSPAVCEQAINIWATHLVVRKCFSKLFAHQQVIPRQLDTGMRRPERTGRCRQKVGAYMFRLGLDLAGAHLSEHLYLFTFRCSLKKKKKLKPFDMFSSASAGFKNKHTFCTQICCRGIFYKNNWVQSFLHV